jgi:hypothetical protein
MSNRRATSKKDMYHLLSHFNKIYAEVLEKATFTMDFKI